ncbi:MAG: hypothetical protein PVS2B2_22230 [Candidatus Acidiferrum sp.]
MTQCRNLHTEYASNIREGEERAIAAEGAAMAQSSSLRRPTLFRPERNLRSQERKCKKESVGSVRSRNTIRDANDANDGAGWR